MFDPIQDALYTGLFFGLLSGIFFTLSFQMATKFRSTYIARSLSKRGRR